MLILSRSMFAQFVHKPEPAQNFEQSEGFLDRFRSVKTLREKFKKLCGKLNEPIPANIDKMSKNEIMVAIKKLKSKYPKTKGGSDLWKMFSDLASVLS